MAKILEVRGFGHFVVTVREGDANPLQLVPASPAEVAEDLGDGNVPLLIPRSPTVPAPSADERCPVWIFDGVVDDVMRESFEYRSRKPEAPAAVVAGSWATMPQGVALRAVAALVKAFPAGLSRQSLNAAARAGDARSALTALADKDPLWHAALRFPRERKDYRQQGLGYRIGSYAEIIEVMMEMLVGGLLNRELLYRAVYECGPEHTPAHLQELLKKLDPPAGAEDDARATA